jgi:hypothetical protein
VPLTGLSAVTDSAVSVGCRVPALAAWIRMSKVVPLLGTVSVMDCTACPDAVPPSVKSVSVSVALSILQYLRSRSLNP